MNKDIEEFYDKEFPDSKKRSRKEVIDFVDKYNKKSARAERVGNCLTGNWKETMVHKHKFDVRYNWKHINWKAVGILFVIIQVLTPLIVGLIYNDIYEIFIEMNWFMCIFVYPAILFLIVFGSKEPYQTNEDYIENDERK